MPLALLVLTGQGAAATPSSGEMGAALAVLLVGSGMHTAQTAELAPPCDLAPEHTPPRVAALLYGMLLVGMLFSALIFSRSTFRHRGKDLLGCRLNLIGCPSRWSPSTT